MRRPAVAKVGWRYGLHQNASVRLPFVKRKRFLRVTAVPYMLEFYRLLQLTLEYDTAIRRTWVMVAGRNFAFKIAAKPLQNTRLYW